MRRYGWKSLLFTWFVLAAVFASGSGAFHRWVFHVATAGATVFVVVGLRRHRPAFRTPWVLFAVGTGLVTVAATLVDVLRLPTPSFAEPMFASGYLCVVVGLLLLAGRRLAGGMLVAVVDGLAAVLSAGLVAWVFVLSNYANDDTVPAAMRAMVVALPMVDLLLVALCVRILTSRATRTPAQWLITASFLALLVTDALNTPAALRGYHEPSTAVAVGWLVTFALCAASALHPSMADDDRVAENVESVPRVRLAVFAVAIVTAPTVLLVEDLLGAPVDIRLFAAVVIAQVALIVVRLGQTVLLAIDTAKRARRSERRQRTLADASAAMVAATTAQDVYDAVVAGAWAVTGAGPAETAAVRVRSGRVHTRIVARAGAADRDLTGAEFVAPLGGSGAVLVATGAGDDDTTATLRTLAAAAQLALDSVETIAARQRESGARLFQSLIGSSADAIAVIGADLSLTYRSPSIEALLGLPADELTAADAVARIHPDDMSAARAALEKVALAPGGAPTVVECRLRHKDGTWRGVEATLTNLVQDPDVQGIVLNARDVTERRELEGQLVRQALHDGLTGLPNRSLFVDRVGQAQQRRRRDPEGAGVAVLFVDLDEFKVVNDSLGHPVGDALLGKVAERLLDCARETDTVARLGGDEFAILVEGPDAALTATAVAQRVLDALRPGFDIDGEPLLVTASIGVVVADGSRTGADELLRDADLAMYVAKRSGKNCFELYDPSMYEAAVRRRQLSAELRTAIDEDQLVVHYQPIVDLATTQATGVEALVRWQHPHRGLVQPGEFIPIAEETGLVVDLGRVVLRRACRDVQEWRRDGRDLYVSVNISARHLAQDSLVADVQDALHQSGLPPAALLVEITETAVMHDVALTAQRLDELKRLGVRIAVDDFGTGFSSLAYLSRFDVDVLKVDRSFVERLGEDEGDILVRAVVDLAAALGLTTVAEGIETAEQHELLQRLGCAYGQGYYFARPMPADRYFAPLAVL